MHQYLLSDGTHCLRVCFGICKLQDILDASVPEAKSPCRTANTCCAIGRWAGLLSRQAAMRSATSCGHSSGTLHQRPRLLNNYDQAFWIKNANAIHTWPLRPQAKIVKMGRDFCSYASAGLRSLEKTHMASDLNIRLLNGTRLARGCSCKPDIHTLLCKVTWHGFCLAGTGLARGHMAVIL